MLDIDKRIKIINELLQKDTVESLTYAALESRLTIEYLCYERFKLAYPYLSSDDLKNWQPKHVVKQVSEDVDENVAKGFTLSIASIDSEKNLPKTKTEYESLDLKKVGEQTELKLNKLHSFWHGLANVALHIPVPSNPSDTINIYGDKEKIKKKVEGFIKYLSGLKGNLLMVGTMGQVFTFECVSCNTKLQKPLQYLDKPTVMNCINPKCSESYLVEPGIDERKIKITRRVFKFSCKNCDCELNVPGNMLKKLKLDEELNIRCQECKALLTVIMRPLIKENEN